MLIVDPVIAATLIDGLALAATLKSDRNGAAIRHALSDDLASSLEQHVASLRGLSSHERERTLASVIASLRPSVPEAPPLPARALAMLATEVHRSLGARWMASAPLPRRGFRTSAALRASLRRIASSESDMGAELAARDEAEGRVILQELVHHVPVAFRDTLLEALGPGRTDSVEPSENHRPRRIAFVRALIRTSPAQELCRIVGAAERGARGESHDAWARAGREMNVIWERSCRE